MRASTRTIFTPAVILEALAAGARNTIVVALACACAGIVIGTITLTGLGLSFTGFVLGLAQNSLILALLFMMIAGIVLGMGLPTTPAYIVQVALLVPAIVKLGVPVEAAHLFALYFAVLSAITPPVALAVYAANGLSRASLMDTSWAAVKLGLTGYIIPFMFVYGPSLLLIGEPLEIVQTIVTATIGVVCLAGALHGWFVFGAARLWERVLLIAGALVLIKPGLYTDLAGVVLIALTLLSQKSIRPEGSRARASGDRVGSQRLNEVACRFWFSRRRRRNRRCPLPASIPPRPLASPDSRSGFRAVANRGASDWSMRECSRARPVRSVP